MSTEVGSNKHARPFTIDRVLHWIAAALMLFMLLEMGGQIHLTDYQAKGIEDHKYDAYLVHLVLGGLLTFLLITRLFWNKANPQLEKRLNFSSTFHRHFVSIYHKGFYLLLFVMVASGFIAMRNGDVVISFVSSQWFPSLEPDKKLFNQALELHLFLEDLLYLYIIIHVFGALHNRR